MLRKNTILLGIAGLSLGVFFIGQGTGITQTKDTTLKTVAVSKSQPDSGKQMYKDYCAACHGMDGRGDGPAVQFLKAPPPDLTTMAKRYNEKSVELRVTSILRFGTESKAHGTLDMPIWGRLFDSLGGVRLTHPEVTLRISNLTEYLQSMQKK